MGNYGVGMYWYANATSNSIINTEEVLNIPPLPEGFPNDKEKQ